MFTNMSGFDGQSRLLYLLSWQETGGNVDPIGIFSTSDRAIMASRGLACGFVLWGEHTSCVTSLSDGREGRFWLTEMPLDAALTMEDV